MELLSKLFHRSSVYVLFCFYKNFHLGGVWKNVWISDTLYLGALCAMLLCTLASCVKTSWFWVGQTSVLCHLWCVSKAKRAAVHKIHERAVVLLLL